MSTKSSNFPWKLFIWAVAIIVFLTVVLPTLFTMGLVGAFFAWFFSFAREAHASELLEPSQQLLTMLT